MRLLVALGLVALIVAGALFLSAPPAIVVAPEHIFSIGGIAVTNTMFTSWVVVATLCTIAIVAGRSMSVVPHGFSGAVEALVGGFFGIVVGIAGERNGRRFFWVIATIFLYVWVSNYFGLLPINGVIGKPEVGHGAVQVAFKEISVGGLQLAYIPIKPATCEGAACDEDAAPAADKAAAAEHAQQYGVIAPYFRSVNTDANTPLAIAIFSFVFVEYWGLSTLGPSYLTKFFNFGALLRFKPMGIIDVFVGLLELISELSRTISFTFRLFGNIFAGEVLLTMITALVPLVLIQVFYGLELLVGLIQAFVFAMLTLVFAQMATAHHGGDGHAEGHSEAH